MAHTKIGVGQKVIKNMSDNRKTVPIPPVNPMNPWGPGMDPMKDGPKDLTKTVKRPQKETILDRMRRVDPDQARRYRQRSGQ